MSPSPLEIFTKKIDDWSKKADKAILDFEMLRDNLMTLTNSITIEASEMANEMKSMKSFKDYNFTLTTKYLNHQESLIRSEVEAKFLADVDASAGFHKRKIDGNIERNIAEENDNPSIIKIEGEYYDEVELITKLDFLNYNRTDIEEEVEYQMKEIQNQDGKEDN